MTIRNGSGIYGAGIYNNATLNLTDSTVSGNTAISNNGGGIYNNDTMTVTNGTISGNIAGAHGGGIYNSNSTTLTVTNSTISGNTASGTSQGGGIYNNGPLTVTSSTISGNTAGGNGGGIIVGTAGGSHLNLKNTIVAGNTGPVTGPDCFGAVTSQGHNLIQTVTAGCVISGDTSGNITGQDAKLSPLALNSPGTTETQALLPNSPAVDAGSSDCPPPLTDQRGVVRPLGVACDIGAYEVDPRGDTNCDGKVDGLDLLDVLSDVGGVGTPAVCHQNGDVDGDGHITTTDALLIAQYWAGVITTFPSHAN